MRGLQRVKPGRLDRAILGGRPQQRRGVSERTVTTMLVQLSAALDDAVEQGLLTRNVARLVERHKITAAEMQTWTREQVAAFRAQVRGHGLHACLFLTLCVLRRSEVLGLSWSSVDLDAGTVAVVAGRVALGSSTESATRSLRGLVGCCPECHAGVRTSGDRTPRCRSRRGARGRFGAPARVVERRVRAQRHDCGRTGDPTARRAAHRGEHHARRR
ncbi:MULTISPECIES: hypothetical protein [unclassified Rhodococcus (in: high G+C Gram-positive bacteria)]|uniref:hypothetical protein n=1 Tax=unclassified Rhodococcus (in: high G+C Gram-positive bacteria) TaxID=192944 RepID=UPI0024B7C39E|nr:MULTISPECIES: hypothetical protein [unclassified Rhodococcus (in: high G+C Gram-positive bacteria)]MDI9959032.1 hypothetical protein [Rhodococcus sp. IEGM 1237]MDI9964678.1 hypothetical protein [Rhodococcus sp. IEGM 1251]MDV8126705.1 hypothetical protein [Rhodococcus sp. IEGM 1304]